MKILVFYQYFGTPKGKWSTRIYELTRRWVAAGHDVTVVTSPYEKSDITATKKIERQCIEGINLVVINYPDSNRFSKIKRIKNFIIFSLYSIYYAFTLPADIAIASSGPITIGLPVVLARIFKRKLFVFEVRDLWPEGAISLGILTNKYIKKLSYYFESLCYRKASLVVGCSKGMTDDINARFPQVKTEIIPNASDIGLFQKNKIDSANHSFPYFIYTGSLGVMDDVDLILEGAKILKDRGVNHFSVEIIGDGAERVNLEEKVTQLGLTNVIFRGLMPKMEVVTYLQNAMAAFVCFKPIKVLNTVSPNKMFDAFAAGVPIIQNTDGWIYEYVNQNGCGLNVTLSDPNSMADAMYQLLTSEDLQKQMSANASEAAERDFNRDKLSNKYLCLLENVVNG